MTKQALERYRMVAPPWMIIGVSALLMAVVVALGIVNHNRETKTMVRLLNEKGAALIRSFEAGARTGMMGSFGSGARMQTLMEESAALPDIAYVVLVDSTGTVLAHNDDSMIGKTVSAYAFGGNFEPAETPGWREVTSSDGKSYFEVYKRFLPVRGQGWGQGQGMGRGHHRNMMSCEPGWLGSMASEKILDPEHRPAIIIGMDSEPFQQALAQDIRNSAVILGLIFLLGVTGVVTLFWAQRVIASRKLLHDTRAFASEIVSNLPVGMVVVGRGGDVLYINDVARRMLGIGAGQQALTETVLPAEIRVLHSRIHPDLPVAEGDVELKRPGHDAVPVSVSVTDVPGDDGHPLGFMVVMKDLTELRRLEQEIQRREKMAAIGNLAAGIAHEVRNPLSSIKGYAAYLGSLFDESSENRKVAGIMADEVDRVNRVISELLEFSRPAELKRSPTDLSGLVSHCLGLVAHEREQAGISLDSRIDPALPRLFIDPDRMTQVLLNVLLNAIQAMNQGGRLTVDARTDDGYLVLDIRDTGPGIPAEDLAHVFNPYFTLKKNGTGLGLAIVNKIVDSHGGTVRIRSDESGTTVSIGLPLTRWEDV